MTLRAACLSLALLVFSSPVLALDGDLGRRESNVWNDTLLPWLGMGAAAVRGEPVSLFSYTDEEKDLRAMGHTLVMPIHRGDDWNAFWADLVQHRVLAQDWPWPSATMYCQLLLVEPRVSARSRYAHVLDNIRADRTRIPSFYAKAYTVVEADRVREAALTYVNHVNDTDFPQAGARIRENQLVLKLTRKSILARIEAYRCALERLVVSQPEPEAVAVERELMALEQDMAQYSSHGADANEGGYGRPRYSKDGPQSGYFPMSERPKYTK